jgi:peroxiredoxin
MIVFFSKRFEYKGLYLEEIACMKRGWLLLLVLLLLVIFPSQVVAADMLGSEAPDFTLQDLDGKPFRLSQYLGQTVMLVHFNVYCGPCREDVPLINKINQLYYNYGDFQIVGIAMGNDETETGEFKEAFKPEFLILPDPKKEVYKKYFVSTIPLVDIIDKSGTIRYRGKFPSYEELKVILDNMIVKKTQGEKIYKE